MNFSGSAFVEQPAHKPAMPVAVTSATANIVPCSAPPRVRAVFISDVHLGTAACKADYLLDFLRHVECERLYLVGDIIDGWALKSRFFWHQSHNDVIQKVLRKARKGTQVIFVPGNHDEAARPFCGLDFGEIAIREHCEHRLLDGRRLWVVHGDFADGVMQHARWLAFVGDTLYDFALWMNRHFNALRSKLGFGYWSLSQYLKHRVKNAVSFITSFEQTLMHEAARRGYDGVVCGHIHKAEIRTIDGLLYCNDGDWVESMTALIETLEGELRIVVWNQVLSPNRRALHWAEEDGVEDAALPASLPASLPAALPAPSLPERLPLSEPAVAR
jgi:UDP-2,3-diacylglucosamine pyrophosphatase LpxH